MDLRGGISKIDCFNQAGLGQCHAGGHGPRNVPHQLPFKNGTVHGPTAKSDLAYCQSCHGTPGGPGSNPRFNAVFGSLAAGCETSGCHNQKMAHPTPWLTHGLAGNQANACALCHGANFEGSPVSGAPSCKSCHSQLSPGFLPASGCTSCHGTPPNGSTVPNKAGSHAVHLALPEMSGNCSACHSGGGSGTVNHATSLTMAFAAGLNSSAGTASFNGTTCSNVSCHGGKATPTWGGNLDVAANCTGCHQAGTAEYISYHSGQHGDHLGLGIVCTDCHDMTNQAMHFGNVTTKVFENAPATTLRSYLNYNQTTQSCMVSTPPPQGVQFTGCHGGTRTWPAL
jgi:predicted CxxxxCH...CXXCH cytochrome family protein